MSDCGGDCGVDFDDGHCSYNGDYVEDKGYSTDYGNNDYTGDCEGCNCNCEECDCHTFLASAFCLYLWCPCVGGATDRQSPHPQGAVTTQPTTVVRQYEAPPPMYQEHMEMTSRDAAEALPAGSNLEVHASDAVESGGVEQTKDVVPSSTLEGGGVEPRADEATSISLEGGGVESRAAIMEDIEALSTALAGVPEQKRQSQYELPAQDTPATYQS